MHETTERPALAPPARLTPSAWVGGGAVAIVTLGLVVRLSRLSTDSLRLDEPQSLETASMSVTDLVHEAAANDTHPPLYYLLLHLWLRIFGDSPLALHSLSVLFGIAAIPVLFSLGKALAGARVGLLASLLLGLSAFHADYSQEARMYGLLALTAGLSFLCFVHALRGRSLWWEVGYVLSTAAVLYSHVYGLFVALAQVVLVAVYVLAGPERGAAWRGQLRRWGVLLGVPALLYVPWLVVLVRQTDEEVAGGAEANLSWLPEPGLRWLPGALARYAGSLWALGIALAVLAVAAALAVRRHRGEPRRRVLAEACRNQRVLLPVVWILTSTLVPFVLSFVVVPIYQVKYTIAASMAFYLLVAVAIVNLPRGALRVAAIVAVVTASAVTLWEWHSGDRLYWRGFGLGGGTPAPVEASLAPSERLAISGAARSVARYTEDASLVAFPAPSTSSEAS